MKALLSIIALAIFALTASADTNATGIWSGSFNITGPDGQVHEDTAYFVLKQTGSEITGSVGPNEDQQFPIQKGKIEGNKILIEADHEGHPIKLSLVIAENRITGEASMNNEDGQEMKAKLDVKRSK